MNDSGEIVGMVDVLKLTYATLDQINSMSSGEGEGPAWNKFWLSLDNDSASEVSAGESSRMPRTPDTRSLMSPEMSRPDMDRVDSVMPGESASHHGDEDDEESTLAIPNAPSMEDLPFAFKFKAPSGRVHRIQVIPSSGMESLVRDVVAKLGADIDSVGGEPEVSSEGNLGKTGFALSYLDNEGDTVSITTNHDLIEAITLARHNRQDKVDLFVHDPEQPPLSDTLTPHPGLGPLPPPTPVDSVLMSRKGRRTVEEEDSEEESEEEAEARVSKKKTAKVQPVAATAVGGIPNEMLLPGAIAVLAVVIVGVFAFGRSTAK